VTRTERAGAAALALALATATAATGQGASTGPDTCVFGYGKPTACRATADAMPDGTVTVVYRAAGRQAVFRGRSQSGWWSGTLNGAPAMGYELNRGHTVYSTRDLKGVFEHWSAGMQHGRY
jgi:hypothetical protein